MPRHRRRRRFRSRNRRAPALWKKTLRKKNASVVFATQSLADIEGSSIAPAIIESCPTRLFLANERALEPQIAGIYQRFGLHDRPIDIIESATPHRDSYRQKSDRRLVGQKGVRSVRFCGGP